MKNNLHERNAVKIKAVAARLGVNPVDDTTFLGFGLNTGGDNSVQYDIFELVNALLDKIESVK